MEKDLHNTSLTRKIVPLGIGLGILVWMADIMFDVAVFHEGSFKKQLLSPSLPELSIRIFVMLMFVGFTVYSRALITRTKKSAEQLLESEERYRSLVEAARDVIFTVSTEGVITSVNSAFETLTGWQPAEIAGRSFAALVHPEDLPRAQALFEEVLQGRTPDIYESRVRSKSGDYLIGEFRSTPQMREGLVVGALGIARDVTERKKIEQSLQESEARYRDLFENASDLIQIVASEGTFQYVNRAWRDTLGYAEEDVRRLTMLDIIHPDSRIHCMETFQRVISGEKIARVDATFVTKDGRPVMVEGSMNSSMVDGRTVATRGIFRNVTEYRNAEEFINNILETVDEGFIVIDRDFRITSVNRAYRSKLKLDSPDIIGKHCHEVSHHSSRPCFEAGEECAVKRTFETGEPFSAVHQHYDSEGNPVYIETKSFPLKDSLGRIVSAIEIHNDITDKKKLEEQLRHSQKMEAIGTLAGGVAHDFNNILTAIIGYASLLQMRIGEDNPLRPMLDQILASTERAANLTQSLLAFSRKQIISPKLVNLNSIVQRVEKLLARLIGEDIEIRIVQAGDEPTIKADSGQIEQVMINLATNARDAMPQGGQLTIETSVVRLENEFIRQHGYGKAGKFVLLTVADSGTGMDKKTLERVFEPFFTTKEVGKGTGLGLAIVYGIIKQHGGFINAYSEPGAGTTFKVYLPLITAVIEITGASDQPMPGRGTATVLVAEDDASVRMMTKTVLEGFGYTVIEAVDGDDAVVKYKVYSDSIDLLILDVIMPHKNGKEAYEAIRELNPGIEALFMSGYTAEIIHKRGMLDDNLHFLSKPVSPRELLQKVSDMLRGPGL